MFRRLKRLVSTCQKYIAEGANTPALEDPAHKPRLLKRPESSQGSPYATPFTDRGAGEICGLATLQAGQAGAFAWLLRAVSGPDGLPHEAAYFWLTGFLSAFLDNAPTYLAFFELAGGNAKELMGPLAGTLASISMGAVYMGGLTYIGNAPNFMVYAIAEERGVKMPNFFGYMLWASLVLLPLLALLTLLPIPPILRWP